MSLLLDAPPGLRGEQLPRISSFPPSVGTAGQEAVELARMAGLVLDPWQEFVLANALGERPDGKWAAFEVGVVVSRQNGKGGILEARELAGLFLLGERFIVHSAHQFDTSLEHFHRLLALIEDTSDFDNRVVRVSRAHGSEGVELRGGQRIRFRTRTKGGGRGFTGDCLILDEAMDLPESAHGALLPTLSARPNPQVWYTGSAVDQEVQENGVVLARIRERGLRGDDPALAYFEWSVEAALERIKPELLSDSRLWAQANPALGIRISTEHVGRERLSMDARTFAVERLGIGDWPVTDITGGRVIDPDDWAACTDEGSQLRDPVCFAFDVSPDRSSSIAVAGDRADGLAHVEIVEHGRGTGWVVARLAQLVKDHKTYSVLCDPAGPAGSLVPEVEAVAGKLPGGDSRLVVISAKEHAQACGSFFDAVMDGRLRHLGTPELTAAIDGAKTRVLGEAWAWSRRSSAVDISPLVASTLALWGNSQRPKTKARFINLNNI